MISTWHLFEDPCPEFGGFNTKMAREQGHAIQPASKVMYTPLLDMTPSDPDTMMTAMVQAQKLTNETGQVYTVFTADQQLYRVMSMSYGQIQRRLLISSPDLVVCICL